MAIQGIAPYLIVADVARAAEWYRDKLGFGFERIWGEPPRFCMVKRDGQVIMLKQVPGGQPRPNHRQDPDACWDAYIWVTDADQLHAELGAAGVTITRPISDQPYGCRDFDVQDLDGYRLCFGTDTGS